MRFVISFAFSPLSRLLVVDAKGTIFQSLLSAGMYRGRRQRRGYGSRVWNRERGGCRGGDRNGEAREIDPHAPGSSSGSQRVEHPKGLRGMEAANYWRNYGKRKQAERMASGMTDAEVQRNKHEHRRARQDPMLLPALTLTEDQSSRIKNAVAAFYAANPTLSLGSSSSSARNIPNVRPGSSHSGFEMVDWAEEDGELFTQLAEMESSQRFEPTVQPDSPSAEQSKATNWADEDSDQFTELADVSELADDFPVDDFFRDADPLYGLNVSLKDELDSKAGLTAYRKSMEFRKKLPAFGAQQKLLDVIWDNQVCVVSGETGCGKTTQLPQFILDDWIRRGQGGSCKIVCTQPRRISAITVSERIASERAESLGTSVGYQIRLEKTLPRERGSILMCTTGIVLQWLSDNSNLEGISHIIVDEIHEQDVHSDFLLIILKDLRAARPDLRVILMSATINAQKFSDYFGGCPLLEIPGFTFPVEEYYLEDIMTVTNYIPRKAQNTRRASREVDPEREQFIAGLRVKVPGPVADALQYMDEGAHIDMDLIVHLVLHIAQTKPQDEAILIFLPGWEDIKKLNGLLERVLSRFLTVIIPLHSMMPTVNQRQVFERPVGKRKIVIATQIAETSITIEDVVHVIDCGKIKMKHFDVERNLSTLMAQWVSVSNARQRRGRAGRVKSGFCYRLYTSYQYTKLAPYPLPELQRTPLEELCLQIKLLRLGSVAPFLAKAMEPPQSQAVQQALNLLTTIGALDAAENLTPLGRLLARMPAHPQMGKMMILACIFKCINPIMNICAVLSYRDPFCMPLGKEDEVRQAKLTFADELESDHLLYHRVIEEYARVAKSGGNTGTFCWENFLFPSTCEWPTVRPANIRFRDDLRHCATGSCYRQMKLNDLVPVSSDGFRSGYQGLRRKAIRQRLQRQYRLQRNLTWESTDFVPNIWRSSIEIARNGLRIFTNEVLRFLGWQVIRMKTQFAHMLMGMGFMRTSEPYDQDANANSENWDVVRAVILGGLYPNMGLLARLKNKHAPRAISLGNEANAYVFLKSIFGREYSDGSGIVAFFEKIRTRKIYIHDMTKVFSVYPAVMFAKDLHRQHINGAAVISADDKIDIRIVDDSSVETVMRLRETLEKALLKIYENSLSVSVPKESQVLLGIVSELFQDATSTQDLP